jgi:lysophospholipase L1-like esterase
MNRSKHLLPLFLIFYIGTTVSLVHGQVPTRIMLLGDSITAGFVGSDPIGGFRDDLDSLLIAAGAIHDLVGTLNDGVGFDADHEGHGGWTVDMMADSIDLFLAETNPRIVLIHLGTNDLSANQGVATTLEDMENLLARIFGFRPEMSVHLSALIPRNDSKDSLNTELNAGYADIVDSLRAGGYAIRTIDHNSAFRENPDWRIDYLFDHVHPTDAGYAVMARTYFDSLATDDIYGNEPPDIPDPIDDLVIDTIGSRTALLRWTATGDSGSVGTAAAYDVRYSTFPITEENFPFATEAIGEPDPLPSGSAEEFTAGGLEAGVFYYFAIRAIGTSGEASSLSNVPFASTTDPPVAPDDFERTELGPDWMADSTFILVDGELSNASFMEEWDMAVYSAVTDLEAVALRWGTDVDSLGVNQGGLALMLDAPSPGANGYLIFRHRILNHYGLWTIDNGDPGVNIEQSPVSSLPFPLAGDEFEVVVSSDIHGHHFDCFINGTYDTRVSDPAKTQGNGLQLWSGIMLLGNRNNNVDDFRVSGPTANLPPVAFSLLSPEDGDTVNTGIPVLDWEDSEDPNPGDSVLYTLHYGTSASFAPESTTVVGNLLESTYEIPLPGLPDGERIYWKVIAFDTGGLETLAREGSWNFTVDIPGTQFLVHLLVPQDGGEVEIPSPVLVWKESEGLLEPVTYTLRYGTHPGLAGARAVAGLVNSRYALPPLQDGSTYYWKVYAVDKGGNEFASSGIYRFVVHIKAGTGGVTLSSSADIPKSFALAQNYPNPFNPSTSIRYDIPAERSPGDVVPVLLQVYSLRGRLVRTLVDDVQVPGRYVVGWDGRDEKGEFSGSGVYLYRIQAGSHRATRRMTVVE